jgi:hypothetical protein
VEINLKSRSRGEGLHVCLSLLIIIIAIQAVAIAAQPDLAILSQTERENLVYHATLWGIQLIRMIFDGKLIVLDREFTHHSIIAHYHRAIAIYITKTEIRSIVRVADGQDTIHLSLLIEGETGKEICSDHPYIALCITIHSGAKIIECLVELSFYFFILTRWNDGLHRFEVEHLRTFLESYPNPKSVMAFVENHDTDRFLGEGKDTLALKQALSLLLTINRTPQLYYGTEVLMNGTKSVTDGNVRKDFPGGWAGDKHNAFTAEGRTQGENQMFDWLSRLLHWRQGNEVITKGKQTQFCPQKGVYVIARQYKGKNVMTIINGKKEANELNVSRYAEIIGNAEKATDVTNGRTVLINKNVKLRPRQTMILEF